MTDTITTTNERGQVASFAVSGPLDPRAQVLRQRIARGELREGDQTKKAPEATVNVLAGVRDEKGDLLLSVHGGGIDPDAVGDARGIPSGSGVGAAEAAKGHKVAGDALALMESNADSASVELSETTKAVKVAVDTAAEGARKSK